MHPSAPTAGPTADRNRPQGPPSPGSGAYHPVVPLNNGAALKRGGPSANSQMRSELAQLMEEPPGGANNGRRASTNPEVEGRHLPLGADDWAAAEFMRAGGWTFGTHKDGTERTGMRAHRGALHPDEHIDTEALRPMVEAELGFTYEQVRSVYRQGPLSDDQRQLREAIDARVLALSRSGAHVALLGAALGFPVKDDGHCRVMENALTRARAKEVTP